ncbi:GerMN domain-containing protein [Paenibacillus tuaregi]|uniref:GerMN domain-containing protein n=1 Tax=Paenibacillus tuaregi TaxID=1816681 RepID=UPI0008399DE7|nr:GerMN domain-containing protein [Paenibacillus tuaregi]
MKRGLWIAGVLLVLAVLSVGCGQKPETAPSAPQGSGGDTAQTGQENKEPANTANGAGQQDQTEPPKKDPQDDKKTLSIRTYYTDNDMMDLKEKQREISYKNDKEKYEEAFKSLQSSEDDKLFALWQKVKLKSVDLKSGELTIDIELPGEARLGAGGEVLAIDALKRTFFQFNEVKTIELLVDGSKVDTLMGHEELEHPMTRSAK